MKEKFVTKFESAEREKIVQLAHRTLKVEDSDEVKEARDYLFGRGLNDEIIDKFMFGYIPERTGHDWRGRVIMPLYDQYNSLLVLTSRNFRATSKKEMAHLHEQFNKKRYLYGLNIAKKEIIKRNAVIIVEGQFDTTLLHMHGLANTVGLLGSAFTFDHMCLLRRYCQNFYFLLDNDDSGRSNLKRAIDIYEEERLGSAAFNTNFYPVFFNQVYKDPDELIRGDGISALKRSIREAYENKDLNIAKVRIWKSSDNRRK